MIGQGRHSEDGVSKLRPALEELFDEYVGGFHTALVSVCLSTHPGRLQGVGVGIRWTQKTLGNLLFIWIDKIFKTCRLCSWFTVTCKRCYSTLCSCAARSFVSRLVVALVDRQNMPSPGGLDGVDREDE